MITITVMMIEAMTKIMVKSMYFPMRGTALEVEGMSSTITSKNTVRDNRTEILRVIFSPTHTCTQIIGWISHCSGFSPLVESYQIQKHFSAVLVINITSRVAISQAKYIQEASKLQWCLTVVYL